MIHIKRKPFAPDGLLQELIDQQTDKLVDFFNEPEHIRYQRNPPFDDGLYSQFMPALRQCFHSKCSFCERKVAPSEGELHLFRPRNGVAGLGDGRSTHYWWLAYEWQNMYLACTECSFSKGFKFPVRSHRGPVLADLVMLRRRERPLLIDPCVDDPNKHLVFEESGFVVARSIIGRVTVEILNLNRPSLVEERRIDLEKFRRAVVEMVADKKFSLEWVAGALEDGLAFAAAKRHCFRRIVEEDVFAAYPLRDSWVAKLIKENTPVISKKGYSAVLKRWRDEVHEAEQTERTSPLGQRVLITKTPFIRRIELKNFRNLEDVTIELGDLNRESKPWLVMIGENGMGKSSVLKAVALALMDDTQRTRLNLSANDLLRHSAQSGYVRVYVDGYSKPFSLEFNSKSSKVTSNKNVLHSLLFCYGGTRLLPNSKTPDREIDDTFSRTGNLFDPFYPLTDAKSWLLKLSDEQFGHSVKAIKHLLGHDEACIIMRSPRSNPDRLWIYPPGQSVCESFHDLSDGYQSIIALVADILQIAFKHYQTVEALQGIVLIDEIDIHLHPKWKLQILELFRKVFPRLQFLITTHDPLCLHGALQHEIHLLYRDSETSSIRARQVDIPPGANADRVLTGAWFNLPSTLDIETREDLSRHRAILRIRSRFGRLPSKLVACFP